MELIAGDSDHLIILKYFWNSLMGEITIKPEATKKLKVIERDIGSIAECIGDVRKYLALVHAFCGWDTTSAVQAQGKLSILRTLEKSKAARGKADVFLQKDRTPEAICETGIRISALLYC